MKCFKTMFNLFAITICSNALAECRLEFNDYEYDGSFESTMMILESVNEDNYSEKKEEIIGTASYGSFAAFFNSDYEEFQKNRREYLMTANTRDAMKESIKQKYVSDAALKAYIACLEKEAAGLFLVVENYTDSEAFIKAIFRSPSPGNVDVTYTLSDGATWTNVFTKIASNETKTIKLSRQCSKDLFLTVTAGLANASIEISKNLPSKFFSFGGVITPPISIINKTDLQQFITLDAETRAGGDDGEKTVGIEIWVNDERKYVDSQTPPPHNNQIGHKINGYVLPIPANKTLKIQAKMMTMNCQYTLYTKLFVSSDLACMNNSVSTVKNDKALEVQFLK